MYPGERYILNVQVRFLHRTYCIYWSSKITEHDIPMNNSHTLKHIYVRTFYRIFMGFSIFYGSPLPCKTNLLKHGVFSRQHTFRNIYLYFHFSQLVWPFLAQQAPGLYLSHHSHYNWPKGNEWSSFMLPFWCLAACSGHVVFRPNWFFFRSLTVQVVVCLMSERCLSLG